MFFTILVDCGGRIGIPAEPELLNEMLSFVVCRQFAENGALLGGNDVKNILLEPLLKIVYLLFLF